MEDPEKPTTAPDDARATTKPSRLTPKRLVPVAVLALGLVVYFALDLDRFITLETLKSNRDVLKGWVENHGTGAGAIYGAIYAAAVAFSVPGGVILTIIGGFLFGPLVATVYVVFGATIGATAVFLAARYAFADYLRARAGGALEKMRDGFNRNPFSYLLILRLVPAFPFWLVNLVPAFLGVSTRVYVISTFFGIIPGAFVYALLGDGAGAVIDAGEELDLGIIFQFRFLAPIVGLIVLACIPLAYRWLRGGDGAVGDSRS